EKFADCGLDYKTEFETLNEKHKKLCLEHAALIRAHEDATRESERLRAQIDIVHLIFGKE
ncbi:MAG: hypothetical protein IKL99_03945, partial [Oscillospiraceae bacterium]|nr:hypothetical protein [Oscillospiraceae bacterium]